MTGQPYEAPALTEIGTLDELTLVGITKTGGGPDALGPIVTGSTIIITPN